MIKRERLEKIIDFIKDHPNCSVEEGYNGVKDHMARRTYFNDLKELKKDNKIIAKNKNHRDKLLNINNKDLLILVSNELEYFIKPYDILAEKTFQRIEELQVISAIHYGAKLHSSHSKTHTSKLSAISKETYDLSTQLIDILLRVLDSYIFKGILIWSKTITNKEILMKIYDYVFSKLSDKLSYVLMKLEENGFTKSSEMQLKAKIVERLKGADFLLNSEQVFKKSKLSNEINIVINAIWNTDREIQEFVYLEPIVHKLDFRYEIDGYQKLLNLYKPYYKN